MKKKSANKKKKYVNRLSTKNILNYVGVTLLCAFSTYLLLMLVAETQADQHITGLPIIESAGVTGLGVNFVGIFIVILIGFFLYCFKKK